MEFLGINDGFCRLQRHYYEYPTLRPLDIAAR